MPPRTVISVGVKGVRQGIFEPQRATMESKVGPRAWTDQSPWSWSFEWKISWKSSSRTASADVLREPLRLYAIVQPREYAEGVRAATERMKWKAYPRQTYFGVPS